MEETLNRASTQYLVESKAPAQAVQSNWIEYQRLWNASYMFLQEELKVKTRLCLAHWLQSYRDFPLSVSIPETTTETYTANEG